MNKYLIKLANHLDKKGLHKEADYVDWILRKRAGEDDYDQRRIDSQNLNELDSHIMREAIAKDQSVGAMESLKETSTMLTNAVLLLEELNFKYYNLLKKGQSIECNSQMLQDIEMTMADDHVDADMGQIPAFETTRNASDVIDLLVGQGYNVCRGGVIIGNTVNELANMQNDAIELYNKRVEQYKLTYTGRYIENNLGGLDRYKVQKVFLQTPSDL